MIIMGLDCPYCKNPEGFTIKLNEETCPVCGYETDGNVYEGNNNEKASRRRIPENNEED